jgi:hypothetical protein
MLPANICSMTQISRVRDEWQCLQADGYTLLGKTCLVTRMGDKRRGCTVVQSSTFRVQSSGTLNSEL